MNAELRPKVRLWDLPGAGTAAVPAESYLQVLKPRVCIFHPGPEILSLLLILTS